MSDKGSFIRLFSVLGLFSIALVAWGGDFSVDPNSPEVPFTFSPGDIVNHNGGGLNVAAQLLGLDPADNVDAFSYGDDQVEPGGIENIVNFDFSVDRDTVGNGGTVSFQKTGNGAAGDKFRIILFKSGRTVGPFLQSDAPTHLLAPLPPPESDLDGMSLPAGTKRPVYFSVDRATASRLGVSPADILVAEDANGTAFTVFSTAAELALDPTDDNIDALAMADNGKAFKLDDKDVVYISVDKTSPSQTAFAPSGGDVVMQVWPKPNEVILTQDQLGLSLGADEELNAMTARDPGPFGIMRYLLKLKPNKNAFFEIFSPGNYLIKKGRVAVNDAKENAICFQAREPNTFGIVGFGEIGDGPLCTMHVTTVLDKSGFSSDGSASISTEWDIPPGPIGSQEAFVFSRTRIFPDGMETSFNVDGSPMGETFFYSSANSVETSIKRDAVGHYMAESRRFGDENWDVMFEGHGPTGPVALGVGGVGLPPGERGYISNVIVIGDNLATAHEPYLKKLREAVELEEAALKLVQRAQDPENAEKKDKDIEAAKGKLDKAIECLRGKEIKPEPPKGQPKYSGGLINMIKEGTLKEGTPKKGIVKTLEKVLRRDVSAREALDAKKPKLKKAVKRLKSALGIKGKKLAGKKLAATLLQLGNKKA